MIFYIWEKLNPMSSNLPSKRTISVLYYIIVLLIVIACLGSCGISKRLNCTHYTIVPVTTIGANGIPVTVNLPVCDTLVVLPKPPKPKQ
jgi:hypothetical protein